MEKTKNVHKIAEKLALTYLNTQRTRRYNLHPIPISNYIIYSAQDQKFIKEIEINILDKKISPKEANESELTPDWDELIRILQKELSILGLDLDFVKNAILKFEIPQDHPRFRSTYFCYPFIEDKEGNIYSPKKRILKRRVGNSDDVSEKRPYMSLEAAKNIVKRLEKLDYYKYANPKNLSAVKKRFAYYLSVYGVLHIPISGTDNSHRRDGRVFYADGEELFVDYGMTSSFKYMLSSIFKKMNLIFDIQDTIEEEHDRTKLEIIVNTTKYVLFENLPDYYLGSDSSWKEATQWYANIINHQLKLQNSKERLYLIHAECQGLSIFLTKEQYDLLDSVLDDVNWKPLTVKKWCEVFKADPIDFKFTVKKN